MATLQEREAERQAAMQRMGQLMDKRQQYVDWRADQDEDERRRAESLEAKDWGSEGAQGAATGMAAGGPWGALIGGIAGTAQGQQQAYKQRRKEGQGSVQALGRTLFDFENTPKGIMSSKGAQTSLAQGIAGERARRKTKKKPETDLSTVNAQTGKSDTQLEDPSERPGGLRLQSGSSQAGSQGGLGEGRKLKVPGKWDPLYSGIGK